MVAAQKHTVTRHPERSEGSQDAHSEILRCAQDDEAAQPPNLLVDNRRIATYLLLKQ
jgi:hypothetical protein